MSLSLTSRRAAALMVVAYSAALIALPPLVGLRVDYLWLLQIYVLAIGPALALAWITFRKLDVIKAPIETLLMTLLVLPPQLVMTFVAMRAGRPMTENLLIGMDRALGFDWPAFVRWIDARPDLAWILGLAYSSVFLQMVLVPPALCFLGRVDRACRLILCFGLLGMAATSIAIFFPSLSGYAGYGVDISSLQHINARNSLGFDRALAAVRGDPGFVLSGGTASGIVTFPSIHAGVAALLIWGAWPTRLRYTVLVLDTLMIVGAITHGAHYLADVIGGVSLAAFVVAGAGSFRRANIPTRESRLAVSS